VVRASRPLWHGHLARDPLGRDAPATAAGTAAPQLAGRACPERSEGVPTPRRAGRPHHRRVARSCFASFAGLTYFAPIQKAAWSQGPSKAARGVARWAVNSSLNRAISWRTRIGVPAALPTWVWILQLKKHAIHRPIVMGLIAPACVEETVRMANMLEYEATMVKGAAADYFA